MKYMIYGCQFEHKYAKCENFHFKWVNETQGKKGRTQIPLCKSNFNGVLLDNVCPHSEEIFILTGDNNG